MSDYNKDRVDANEKARQRSIEELSDGTRILAGENPLCKCGHALGVHYVQQDWPACSECDACRGFERLTPVHHVR